MKSITSFCIGFICLSLLGPRFAPPVANAQLHDSFLDRFRCDDPYDFVAEYEGYDFDCVDASIPPWPICLFHNVTYFIDAAVASASRCCDPENLDECRCPKKYTERFQDVMSEWCPRIAKCNMTDGGIKSDMESEAPMAWEFMQSMEEEEGPPEEEEYEGDGDDDPPYYEEGPEPEPEDDDMYYP